MSGLRFGFGFNNHGHIIHTPVYSGNDPSIQPDDYRPMSRSQDGSPSELCSATYAFSIWSRSNFVGSGVTENVHFLDDSPQRCGENFLVSGTKAPKKVSGVTRDSVGAVLPSSTVQLFNTSTGLLVDTQTSDLGGNYTLNDPNNTTNFVVGYKSGSPDIAGTTKNNLSGT